MTDRAYIPWVVVGCGRLGTTISLLSAELGVDLKAVWSRSGCPRGLPKTKTVEGDIENLFEHLGGAVVWLTVADDAIVPVARQIARHLRPADIVLHCSGMLDSRALRAAGIQGPVASLHPLLAVTEPKAALANFSECAWTVEGDFPAVAFAKWMLGQLGVDPFEIQPEQKVLYHASAVMSAGLLDALMDAAFSLAEEAGFSGEQARALLLPLARSTLKNLESRDTAAALTGPVARGDEDTIERHLEAIEGVGDENVLEIYSALTRRASELSRYPH